MKILIVEDQKEIAEPLAWKLEVDGYAVDMAHDGQAGLRLALVNEYDCILLDLNLPKKEGLEVAAEISKQENYPPIIMITARNTHADMLTGFETGADDYIKKPFSYDEVLARIQAAIRRDSTQQQVELKFGSWQILPEQNMATRESGAEIELTNKEVRLLEYLLRQQPRIISTEELLEHVWDGEVNIFSDTVKTHIKTLRKKLDPRKNMLKSKRGKGYYIDD